jgi:8-oxo-dGTP pyrophosphatase MutT (NUDIX family)
MKGKSAAKSAAREAFEEAGVRGKIDKSAVGAYTYDKRLKNGRIQRVRVTVFALQVEAESDLFPEAAQRERMWASPEAAARAVEEPELMVILATFHP